MSGGSYNYLCFREGWDIGQYRRELNEMIGRLDGIDADSHAACDTREVLVILTALDAAVGRIGDVWHAVEWCDSGDIGDEQMHKILAEYNARRDAEET